MKTTNKGILTPIDKEVMKELLTETKETVQRNNTANNGSAPIFSPVDLWRVHKKHKSLGSSTKW